jgi:outer membrane protein insertion porin family
LLAKRLAVSARFGLAAALLAGAPTEARADDDPYAELVRTERPPAPPEPAPPAPAAPLAETPPQYIVAEGDEAAGLPVRVRYTLEGIELRGNQRTADRVVLRYVRFRAGDLLDVDDPELELTRYRLLGTGFFSSAELSLRRGSKRGNAVLVIDVVERNTLIVRSLSLGIAADEDADGTARPLSPFIGVDVAETNLIGSGVTLGAGIGLASDQLALRLSFSDPAIMGTPNAVGATLVYAKAQDYFGTTGVSFESPLLDQREVTDYAVVAYKRLGGTLAFGRDLSVVTQLRLGYDLERIEATVPTVASHLRGGVREPIDFDILSGKSVLSELSAGLTYDSRDSPSLPTRGTLASVSLAAGLGPAGSAYRYQRLTASYERWWRLPWEHVVRLDTFAGAVTGEAPFFKKFYVGDFTDLLPDRVLELAPDRRQPPNLFQTAIAEVRYGDYAARLAGEYRVPLYTGRESVYAIDFFTSLGLYAVATRREISDPAAGYEGLARLPFDLTYNLGLRIDTNVGLATFAFSNFLGLLPARGGDRK